MKIQILLLTILTLSITACGPVHNTVSLNNKASKQINSLAIQMESKGQFEVIMDRGNATAAPAAMFGLIGAVAASAYNSSQDKDKEEILTSKITGLKHKEIISNGLFEGLNQQSHFSVLNNIDKHAKADGILKVTVKDWGIKISDKRHGDSLTPFVEVRCIIKNSAGNKKLLDVHETYYGDQQHTFSEYVTNNDLLKNELEAVLHDAGLKIGTRLAFSIGEKS